jgi:hypothetical protein
VSLPRIAVNTYRRDSVLPGNGQTYFFIILLRDNGRRHERAARIVGISARRTCEVFAESAGKVLSSRREMKA